MERAFSPSSFDNPDPSAARWAGMFSRLQRLGFDSHLRLHPNSPGFITMRRLVSTPAEILSSHAHKPIKSIYYHFLFRMLYSVNQGPDDHARSRSFPYQAKHELVRCPGPASFELINIHSRFEIRDIGWEVGQDRTSYFFACLAIA
jgi:hypothetical protein